MLQVGYVCYELLRNHCCVSLKLELLVSDIKMRTKDALKEAYKRAQDKCVAFIGAWTSGATIEISKLLAIPPIDRAIISYRATSPRLSDFSNVLRTKASDKVPVKLMAKLMKGLLLPPKFVLPALCGERRTQEIFACHIISTKT